MEAYKQEFIEFTIMSPCKGLKRRFSLYFCGLPDFGYLTKLS